MRCLFLIAACVAHIAAGQQDCDLDCNGRGTCTNKTATFPDQPIEDEDGIPLDFLKDKEIGGKSCVCNDGWTGLNCDTKVALCEGSIHACYHGGVCVDGMVEGTDEVVQLCDCRNAKQDGIRYIGFYCHKPSPVEHPGGDDVVPNSIVCDPVTMQFCINGGTCMIPL